MVNFDYNKIKEVAEDYGIADVYLFGSQILGFAREDSDVDIAVRFKKGLPKAEERGKIYGNLFSDLLFCFENKNIDLVFLDEVLLRFQYNIVNDGKLIYSKNMEEALNFQENIFNYYRDYKYFIDEYYEGVLESSTN